MKRKLGILPILGRDGTQADGFLLHVEAVGSQAGQFTRSTSGISRHDVEHGPLHTVEPADDLLAITGFLDKSNEFRYRQGTSHQAAVLAGVLSLQIPEWVTNDSLGLQPPRECLDGPNVMIRPFRRHPRRTTLLQVLANLVGLKVGDASEVAPFNDDVDLANRFLDVSIAIILRLQITAVILNVVFQRPLGVLVERIDQASLASLNLPDQLVEHLLGGRLVRA